MAHQDQGNQGSAAVRNHPKLTLPHTEINTLPTSAQLHSDGRINVSLALKGKLPDLSNDHAIQVDEFAPDLNWKDCPRMSIVIMIVGSRGDIQPFVALGKRLKQDDHRVRIATHEIFRQLVTEQGLEFFSIGGNPNDLMSYMVKNPGLIPGMGSLTSGDLKKKRAMLNEMINGCWKSCYEPAPDKKDTFIADVIISNPPSFAHIHCAEALGIPLQMSFTMPWSPTTAFPHPLVNITNSNAKPGLTNYLTYYMVDLLTWKGIGSHINKLRKRVLNLRTLALCTGASVLDDLKIPWTYCVSPTLLSSPEDWRNHIDVVGFYFLDLATKYQPPSDLVAFLNAGDTPIYIGFGSIVVDNPQALTRLIFEATMKAGVRALICAGWGGLGDIDIPPHIFILGGAPHDWLFDEERVSAVVHHGGAGTTAIGLAKGRPTVVVPFFGDQGFWGRMVCQTGAGPKPIQYKKLTVIKLSEAIKYALSPTAKEAARRIARQIHDDNGVERGVQSFYQHLPLSNMRCDLCPTRLAVWWSTRHCLKLSALAAQTLDRAGLIDMRELQLHRTKEYDVDYGFSLTEEVESIFDSVSTAAEKLFSPVKSVFRPPSVPRGILNTMSSSSDLPSSGTGDASRADGPREREGSKTRKSRIKRFSLGLFHRDHESSKRKEKQARRRFSLPLMKNGNPFDTEGKKINCGGCPRQLYGLGAQPLLKVEEQRRKGRVEEGVRAYIDSTDAERKSIIEAFESAKDELPTRRNTYVDAAKLILANRQRRQQSSIIETQN